MGEDKTSYSFSKPVMGGLSFPFLFSGLFPLQEDPWGYGYHGKGDALK